MKNYTFINLFLIFFSLVLSGNTNIPYFSQNLKKTSISINRISEERITFSIIGEAADFIYEEIKKNDQEAIENEEEIYTSGGQTSFGKRDSDFKYFIMTKEKVVKIESLFFICYREINRPESTTKESLIVREEDASGVSAEPISCTFYSDTAQPYSIYYPLFNGIYSEMIINDISYSIVDFIIVNDGAKAIYDNLSEMKNKNIHDDDDYNDVLNDKLNRFSINGQNYKYKKISSSFLNCYKVNYSQKVSEKINEHVYNRDLDNILYFIDEDLKESKQNKEFASSGDQDNDSQGFYETIDLVEQELFICRIKRKIENISINY